MRLSSTDFSIKALLDRLAEPPPHQTIRLLKSAVYGILLLNTLFLLPMADEIWGPESVIMPLNYPDTILYHLFFLLMQEEISQFYYLFLGLQITGILFWFFGKWRFLAAVIIYLTTAMLFTSAHLYTTGGHTLFKLLLFYFLFMSDAPESVMQRMLSNLFLLACKIQLVIVYLFAGLFKLHGTYWLNGEALYYILSLREFSHPVLQDLLLDQPILLKIGTWIGLGYQLLFPVLVWFRKTKKPLLIVGIMFHLLVAFGFGLPDFGLFMIASYAIFVNNKASANIFQKIRNLTYPLQRSLKRG